MTLDQYIHYATFGLVLVLSFQYQWDRNNSPEARKRQTLRRYGKKAERLAQYGKKYPGAFSVWESGFIRDMAKARTFSPKQLQKMDELCSIGARIENAQATESRTQHAKHMKGTPA